MSNKIVKVAASAVLRPNLINAIGENVYTLIGQYRELTVQHERTIEVLHRLTIAGPTRRAASDLTAALDELDTLRASLSNVITLLKEAMVLEGGIIERVK